MNLPHKAIVNKYAPLVAGCLIAACFVVTAETVWAQSAAEANAPVRGVTPGRARSIVGAVIALASVVAGWRAKARRNTTGTPGTRNKSTPAMLALVLGGVAIILSVIHLAGSAGAVFGSGSGKAGAIVALVLALTGVALGGLALRPKRA